MRRGDPVRITLGETERIVTYLGKGFYATAYHHNLAGQEPDNLVYLRVKSEDWTKDCLWQLVRRGVTTHLPALHPANNPPNDDCHWWKMPYYETIRAKDKEAWEITKRYIYCLETAWHSVYGKHHHFKGKDVTEYGAEFMDAALELLCGDIPDALYETLVELRNFSLDYSVGAWFDAKRSALAIDEHGTLILRDPLCDMKLIEEWREQQRRKHGKL